MGIREAAKMYAISTTTLWRRCKKNLVPRPIGGQTGFSEYDEELLSTIFKGFATFSLPIHHSKALEICQQLREKRGSLSFF